MYNSKLLLYKYNTNDLAVENHHLNNGIFMLIKKIIYISQFIVWEYQFYVSATYRKIIL